MTKMAGGRSIAELYKCRESAMIAPTSMNEVVRTEEAQSNETNYCGSFRCTVLG